MANIDIQSFFSSFLPDPMVTKITLEKNNGFFKRIDNPHIESSLEREAQIAEPEGLKVILDIESRTRKIVKQKSFFTDKKILENGMKIAIVVYNEIPQEGFQDSFESIISQPNTNLTNVSIFSINNFDKQSERLVNNVNFLVKKYSSKLFEYANEPQNLFIVYGAYVELPRDYVSRFGFEGRIFSDVKVETVFEDGKVKSKSRLFTLEGTDVIWTGNVSYNSQQSFYETVEEIPRRLEEYSINNYKLQDFRIQSKIEKQQIDFKRFNEEILNVKLGRKVEIEPKHKIYFSDIFLSNRESCNFFFSLSLKQLVLDNCMLSKIYQILPSSLENSILSRTKIVSFKVLRRRISKSGLSTNPLTDERQTYDVMPGEKEETLISCKMNNLGELLNSLSEKCEVKQIKSCFKETNAYSLFFIKDLDLVNKSEGEYQYGIEIELSDPSKNIIVGDLSGLRTSKKVLTDLLEQINKTKNFFIDNETNNFEKEIYYDDPHINDSKKEITLRKSSIPALSSFNQRTISLSVDTYFEVLSTYYTGLEEQKQQEIKDSIKSQISVFNRETSGLENFINLYDNLIRNLEELADNKIFIFDDPHVEGAVGNVFNVNKDSYKVTNYFSNDVANANFLDFKNVNFMNKEGTSYNDLSVSEFTELLGRLKSSGRFETEDKMLPFSIKYEDAKLDPDAIIKLYDDSTYDYQNKIKEDLIKYSNFSVEFEAENENVVEQTTSTPSVPQLASNSFNVEENSFFNASRRNREQEETAARDDARSRKNSNSIKQFYNYIYNSLVKNKNIDQIIKLYQQGELDEFYVKFEFLRRFDFQSGNQAKSGVWQDTKTLKSISYTSPLFQFDENTYLLCRFRPINNNYKNNNWKISEEMNYSDNIFIIKIPTSIEMTQVQSSLTPVSIPALDQVVIPVIDLEPEPGSLPLPSPVLPGVDITFGDAFAPLTPNIRNGNIVTPSVSPPRPNDPNRPPSPRDPSQPGNPSDPRRSNRFNVR